MSRTSRSWWLKPSHEEIPKAERRAHLDWVTRILEADPRCRATHYRGGIRHRCLRQREHEGWHIDSKAGTWREER